MKQQFTLFTLLIFAILLVQCTKEDIELSDENLDTELNFLIQEENTERVRTTIPNKYIVVLKEDNTLLDDIEKIREKAKGLGKQHGFSKDSVRFVYGKVFKGFSVHLNTGQLKKLERSNAIEEIIPDRVVQLAPPAGKGPNRDNGGDDGGETGPAQTTPWGISRVGGAADGTGRTAWIIDTGIDLDHADLNIDQNRGWSAFRRGKDRTPDDGNGHGTHVAGTVAALNNSIGVVGVAAGATVVPVKVLDSNGSGSYSGVLAGVDYVARKGNAGDVANMSLGGPASTDLDNAVRNAANSSGVIFVLAAGNESANVSTTSPARVNENGIYTISAMTNADYLASFSNYGYGVDYAAPGVNIASTYKNGGYATLSGTSMAAPHATGVLLLGNATSDSVIKGDRDAYNEPIIHR